MTTAALTPERSAKHVADTALTAATRLWFATTVVGQALFLGYIVTFYGRSTLSGDYAAWNRNPMLLRGYVAGDTAWNLAFATHVLLAAVIVFGGALQLAPQVRARAPALHRWIGRAFLTTAMIASLVGLFMTWGRQASGALINALAITGDAVLILSFSTLAWRTALARQFASHRRWAMRTFMVANAVWFLRLGFAPWAMVMTALGREPSMHSPFYIFWNFGCYLVPLGVLELYLHVQDRGATRGRIAMAAGLAVISLLMMVGIAGTWLGMFAPVLARM